MNQNFMTSTIQTGTPTLAHTPANTFAHTPATAPASAPSPMTPEETQLMSKMGAGLAVGNRAYGVICCNPHLAQQRDLIVQNSNHPLKALMGKVSTPEGIITFDLASYDARLYFIAGSDRTTAEYILTDNAKNVLASSQRDGCALQMFAVADIANATKSDSTMETPELLGVNIHFDATAQSLPMQVAALSTNSDIIQMWYYAALREHGASGTEQSHQLQG